MMEFFRTLTEIEDVDPLNVFLVWSIRHSDGIFPNNQNISIIP